MAPYAFGEANIASRNAMAFARPSAWWKTTDFDLLTGPSISPLLQLVERVQSNPCSLIRRNVVEQLSANEQDAAGGALIDYLAHRDDTRLDEQLADGAAAALTRSKLVCTRGERAAEPVCPMKLRFDDLALAELKGRAQ